MQIVIDIPEDLYKATANGLDANEIWDLRLAVTNGTPLPKGHGKIGDIDRLQEVFRRNVACADAYKQLFVVAPTIIEADKAEREDEK